MHREDTGEEGNQKAYKGSLWEWILSWRLVKEVRHATSYDVRWHHMKGKK